MSSQATRDPITDPLLTPANSALIMIDYQPVQVSSVLSMDPNVPFVAAEHRGAQRLGG